MDKTAQTIVADLARRVMGSSAAGRIFVEIEPGPGRSYRYHGDTDSLRLWATDVISACVGLRTYIRRELGRDIQWATELPLTVELRPCAPHAGSARVAEQYMYNFCTYSYSTAHWDWADWEREIDWMALHGITMPLSLVGHESVLAEAWEQLGVETDAALTFLGDPVYAPFQFMGCLDGDRPVMTAAWLEQRRLLGQRIVDRFREFGMRPILPAFTGHVPPGWASGNAQPRDWQGNETWFLDPADEQFSQVAATVALIQREVFGEVRHFAADPFIEMTPVDDGTDFPALVGRRLIEGIGSVIDNPVWVMQAWPFSYQRRYWTDDRITAFLDGIDSDSFLVLDLWAEADPIWPIADGFRGKDWLWCGLLNFGGRSDAIADLPRAAAEFELALGSDHPPSGLGLSMESFHHNAVFFELLCDLAWKPVNDLGSWVTEFATQRYGMTDPRITSGWEGLLATVYTTGGRRIFPEDFHGILSKRADLVAARDATAFRRAAASMQWFDPADLFEGWRQLTDLLEQRPDLGTGPLGLDLIEIAQAAAVRIVDERAARALEAENPAIRQDELAAMFDAIDTVDVLLSTRPESRLDTAETKAAAAALGGVDPHDLVTAQRRILTSWNGRPGTDLDDYSGRIWHGLVGGYYRARLEAWGRSIDRSGAESDAQLSNELDAIWADFMTSGSLAHPRPVTDLAATTRALQSHFATTFMIHPAEETI